MNVYWLFLATLLCAFLGYRLAVHYRLSGITGLVIALALCVTLGTSLWKSILAWMVLGDHLVTASGTLLTVATLFAFVEKAKFLAIMKITSMLFPVSFASVSIPHFATNWTPDSTRSFVFSLTEITNRGKQIAPTIEAVQDTADLRDETYAEVLETSLLYNLSERGLVKSSLEVEAGTWVLTGDQVAQNNGIRWIHVMLPDDTGAYETGSSNVGYILRASVSDPRRGPPPE